jgi:hypothetical protein
MTGFSDHHLFPEYVAAESAAAQAHNEEVRSVFDPIRTSMEPFIQQQADTYSNGNVDRFLAQMSKAAKGDIREKPAGMSTDTFYKIYDDVALYQELVTTLKAIDTAYDAGSGVTLWVNGSIDRANARSGWSAQRAMRLQRDYYADWQTTHAPASQLGDKTYAGETVARTVPAVQGRLDALNALSGASSNDDIKKALSYATGNDINSFGDDRYGLDMKVNDARRLLSGYLALLEELTLRDFDPSGLNEEQKSRLNKIMASYGGKDGDRSAFFGVPMSPQEAAERSAGMREDTNERGELLAIYTAINKWREDRGISDAKYISENYRAYAYTDSASDRTITIKLIDPKGKEHTITDKLDNVGNRYFNGFPVSGVFGKDLSNITEAPNQ